MLKFRPVFCALALIMTSGLTACQKTPNLPSDMKAPTSSTPALTENHTLTQADIPTPSSDKEAEIINQMVWVLSADPITDAQSSLLSGSPELIAFSTRFTTYPGLSLEQRTQISDKASDTYPVGSSDVFYGEAHRVLRRALNAYAKIYNQTIYESLHAKP